MGRQDRLVKDTATLVTLAALAAVQVAAAIGGALWTRMPVADVVASYLATNLAIAVSFATCGAILAWFRPRNPTGWLLMAVGLAQGTTAAVTPLLVAGAALGWSSTTMAALATAYAYGWPWSIGVLLPTALLRFPDGHLPSRAWRWVGVAILVVGSLFVVMMGSEPANVTLDDGRVVSHPLTLTNHDRFAALWSIVGLGVLGSYVGAFSGLFARYRRGNETQRRQLLWLLLGVGAALLVPLPTAQFNTGPILLILVICLIPTAIAIAILRHNLLDIRLVVSRAVLWLALTALVVAGYIGLAAVIGLWLAERTTSLLAALLVALAFNPLRLRAQRAVDRLFYGFGRDPVRAVAQVEDQLGRSRDLQELLEAIRGTLQLPYAALELAADRSEIAATSSRPPAAHHRRPLTYANTHVADLIVGLRAGERRIRAADDRVLDLLAAPLSVAVHATTLSTELQRSREELIEARERERRRLRRDLHDGLGPTLTGVTHKADAARNLLETEPDRAAELLGSLQKDVRNAIGDIRRLIHDLRPPALDDLGLLAALRQYVELVDEGRPDALSVGFNAPTSLPPLSAAVEVAVYRVAIEALTNTVRHAQARHVWIRLSLDDSLRLEVTDDGPNRVGSWRAGIGLTAMSERVDELGGTLVAGPAPGGGRVLATFPLVHS